MKTPGGKSKQKSLKTLQTSLLSKAKERKYNLESRTPGIKARNKKVVSKTFHKAGIVVPLDANDVGYRPLTVTDGERIVLNSTYPRLLLGEGGTTVYTCELYGTPPFVDHGTAFLILEL